MKKQIKDAMVSIRINKEIKEILAVKGITVQKIIDAYIDSILGFEIVEKEVLNDQNLLPVQKDIRN